MVTLHIGAIVACEGTLKCESCDHTIRSEELAKLVPKNGKFGFDIIEYVGRALFLDSKTEDMIRAELAARNITMSKREIGYLGRKFIMYLALVHKDSGAAVKRLLSKDGGYILHLDGTCEGASPHLMTAMDEISELVLGNVKIPSEKAALIIPLLKEIKQSFGKPVSIVHDMGKGILDAVRCVFPGIPDYICHYHFLRDIGKDLIEAKYTILRKTLRSYGLKAGIRNFVKKLGVKINRNTDLKKSLDECSAQPLTEMEKKPAIIKAYLWGLWILDYANELSGFGFPFDRAHLAFFDRLKLVYTPLGADQCIGEDLVVTELRALLKDICCDDTLSQHLSDMRQKTSTFEELRTIMRIAEPGSGLGLNDDGTDVNMTYMKVQMTKFVERMTAQLKTTEKPDIAYKKMLRQIDKYWEKLFAAAITVQSPNGSVTLQPQRTNNILERFFRGVKRNYRRKTGAVSLTKTLTHILADTPLVINLNNPAYLEAILNGASSLAERFSQIEISRIRRMALDEEPERVPTAVKKLLRLPSFMPKFDTPLPTASHKSTGVLLT
jgi:hypothetical protein